MGKKKRQHPSVEELLERPWCYYCERDFDDLKILTNHQKAKHFRCERCGRRLNTAGGLAVHMNQVHKENLDKVENTVPGREDPNIEIFGMEGVPEEAVTYHNQAVTQQFFQDEAQRRAATGNPAPGTTPTNGVKKPKKESVADIRKRLAEHRAKKAAQEAGGSSGDLTPHGTVPAGQSPQQPYAHAGSPFTTQQPPFSGTQAGAAQSAFAQPYTQPAYQQPAFQQAPYGQPQQPNFAAQPTQHYPPPVPQQYPPPHNQQFSPPGSTPFQPPFQGAPPAQYGGPASPVPFQQGPFPPQHTLPPSSGPQRPAGLPAAPGLPQRPAFGVPQVNQFQMQQMHQGHVPAQPAVSQPPQLGSHQSGSSPTSNGHLKSANDTYHSATAASVDELISSVTQQAEAAAEAKTPVEKEAGALKKTKKKSKGIKLVYSDDKLSPEEKMAALPRYAYVPDTKEETVLGDTTDAVTGPVQGQDDVIDKMN